MKNKLKSLRIFFIVGIIFPLLVIFSIYYFVLPNVLDMDKYKSEIRQTLVNKIVYPAEIGNLDIKLTWNLRARLKTDRVIITKPDKSKLLELGASYIEVSLPALINKKIVLKKLNINMLNAHITRFKNGKFDITELLTKSEDSKYKFLLKNTEILINGYSLKFTENYIQPAKYYFLVGEKIKIQKFNPGKFIEIYALGKLILNDKNKSDANYDVFLSSPLPLFKDEKLTLKGKIANLDINSFVPYLNQLSAIQFISLAGKGNMTFDMKFNKKMFDKNKFFIESDFDGIKIQTAKSGVISQYNDKIFINGVGYYNNNEIFFDDLKIKSKDMDIKSSGKIIDYRIAKAKKFVDLIINFDNSKICSIAELFPKTIKVKRDPFGKILKHDVKADIYGNIAVKGNHNDPNMFGTLNYSNLSISGGFENTPKTSGKVNFVGSAIIFENKIFINKNDFVNVTGKVTPFREKTINVDVTSSEVDFARVYKILMVLKDFFNMKLGPIPDMTFEGRGRANLNISGKINDVQLNGYVEGKKLKVKYATLSKPADNVQGKIRFTGKKALYDELTGEVEGMQVFPKGYSTFDDYSDVIIHIPKLQLDKGLDFVNKSPLLIEAKTALKDVKKMSGFADATIHLLGKKDNLDIEGEFVLNNANVSYNGFAEPFTALKGLLKVKNEDIYFEEAIGQVKNNNIKVSGFIKGNFDSELKITSEQLNLDSARTFLLNSPILIDIDEVLGDFRDIKGVSSVEVNLKGNLNKKPLENVVLKNMNAVFNHKLTGFPISLNKGILTITPQIVNAKEVTGITEGIDFKINGKVSNVDNYILKNEPLIPDFELNIKKFDLLKFKKFNESLLIPEKARKFLSKFDELKGITEIYLKLKPENFNLKITPANISAVYLPYKTLINVKSGSAQISENGMELSSVKGVFSESEFNLNGFIRNFIQKPEFDLAANLEINYNDIDKFRTYTKIPLHSGGIIPFGATLKGNIDDWKLFGRMMLKKGSYLNYLTNIGLSRNIVRLFTIEASGGKNSVNVEKLRIDVADPAYNAANISINSKNYQGFKNLINLYGVIDNLKSKTPEFRNFIIKTSDENSSGGKLFNSSTGGFLNNGTDKFIINGDFKANLVLNGYVSAPLINGSTSFKDVSIPNYKTGIKSINLTFNADRINLDILDFNIGESIMNINALLDTKLQSPIVIKDLKINSSLFNIDEIAKIFSEKPKENITILPLFVVKNGTLNSEELVVRNLIITDIVAAFNLTPDWLLSVPKVNFSAANGNAEGNIYCNLSATDIKAAFNFNRMQANALATTLLNLPNEAYGTLTGNVKFTTKGKNQTELIANSNGYAEFDVEQGRFVRLGSMEYFLRAVNVLQSGVGGFNINNIIDLVAPQKTGHFETLRGKVSVKDGVIYTDDITSSGKNLSLYISGNLDMLTNSGDIQVLGRLSKKITGLLGPVGSVSINQFIDYIPGLGFLPTTPGKKGVIDYIPGLSKIPGLEISNNEQYRRFVVNIKGNIYDQNSVKSFRWVE
ncbi:MAG TPA: AsmA-like C-terminal region-containing protein [Candidatus Gastranaerophilales bacterium]|nr:AsmA-like C-terminal region-containing protein [Candidatus Gastranaerophilales bacterium]